MLLQRFLLAEAVTIKDNWDIIVRSVYLGLRLMSLIMPLVVVIAASKTGMEGAGSIAEGTLHMMQWAEASLIGGSAVWWWVGGHRVLFGELGTGMKESPFPQQKQGLCGFASGVGATIRAIQRQESLHVSVYVQVCVWGWVVWWEAERVHALMERWVLQDLQHSPSATARSSELKENSNPAQQWPERFSQQEHSGPRTVPRLSDWTQLSRRLAALQLACQHLTF